MFKNKTFEGEVPKLTKWLYCSSGMFRDAAYQFISLFLLTFVQFCGLGGVSFEEYLAMYGVISIVIIILRIWDGINDPIMGFIIEKVHFKSGKYRPWIWIGAVTNSIVAICMFWVVPTGWWYVLSFSVFYFLWDFTYTINDIAFWSVLPSLSNKEKVRANLTTLLSIFISIGTFAVGGIVPMLASGNQMQTYQVTALITSILFALSQIILAIFMKEKATDEKVEENDSKMKFREIFTVFFKNDQLRVSIVAVLLYYTGSSILTAAGLNYFYFNFGYAEGGTYQLIFTVVFALATLIGQSLFPVIVNKFHVHRKKLLAICSIITIVGYVAIFGFVFLNDYKSWFWLLCVVGFIAFFGQTIIGLILYIMIQDSIDYNEYKFGERRESPIFALRAFTAKIASSIQQGILYVFLASSALLTVSNSIANLEREYANVENGKEIILEEATKLTSSVESWQRIVFQIGFAIIPLLLILGCFLIIKFKYKISEEEHEKIVQELEERHQKDKESLESNEVSEENTSNEEVKEEDYGSGESLQE